VHHRPLNGGIFQINNKMHGVTEITAKNIQIYRVVVAYDKPMVIDFLPLRKPE